MTKDKHLTLKNVESMCKDHGWKMHVFFTMSSSLLDRDVMETQEDTGHLNKAMFDSTSPSFLCQVLRIPRSKL